MNEENPLGFREAQSAHTNEIRAVRILTKTLGCTRSQARLAVRQQAERNQARQLAAVPKQVQRIEPAIRRTVTITQEIQHIPRVVQPDVLIVPPGIVPGGAAGIPEVPDDDIFYLRLRHPGDPTGGWFPGVEEALNDGHYYARLSEGWADISDFLFTDASADAVSTIYTNPPLVTITYPAPGTILFSFVIPAGAPGADGSDPTDAHLTELITALFDPDDYAFNPISVALLSMTVEDPPSRAQVQAIADKIDELITALKH